MTSFSKLISPFMPNAKTHNCATNIIMVIATQKLNRILIRLVNYTSLFRHETSISIVRLSLFLKLLSSKINSFFQPMIESKA